MVSLFQENQPQENSALQSSVIRDNFEALFDKVRALETRAEDTPSTSIQVSGGAVYFRAGTALDLRLISFNTTIFSFSGTTGFKTKQDQSGNLFREQQSFSGPSSFESEGLFLEVLVALQPSGQLTFVEALAGQNNELSSPFNIYFDDSEIPIALVILEKSASGELQVIAQERIRDVRPFVTSAFQNNAQIATIEAQVEDNTSRLGVVESALRVTDNLFVRLLSEAKQLDNDPTLTTNTQVEVFSGKARDGYGNDLKFRGALVDFDSAPPSTGFPGDPRTFDAGVGSTGLPADQWNKAVISLQVDNTITDPTENASLRITHDGTGAVTADQVATPVAPADDIPLAIVLYKMNSAGTNIVPILTTIEIDSFRLNYEFTISDLTAVPNSAEAFNIATVDLSGTGFSQSFVESVLFKVNDAVEFFDDNTRRIRRFVQASSYNTSSEVATVTLTDSFTDVSLVRNPKIRSISQHLDVIEDVRPFVGLE